MMMLESRILHYIDCKQRDAKWVAVPSQLQQQIMADYHSGIKAGHFLGVRLYKTLSKKW